MITKSKVSYLHLNEEMVYTLKTLNNAITTPDQLPFEIPKFIEEKRTPILVDLFDKIYRNYTIIQRNG